MKTPLKTSACLSPTWDSGNDESAAHIHAASLALLMDPGVRIEHDGIGQKLLKAGAKTGTSTQVIRFPKGLVAECIEQAPSEVSLADRRDGGRSIASGGESLIWSVPGMNIVRHGKHRPFTSADMADLAHLLDQLPNVDGVFGLSMEDVPPAARDVVGLRIMAENTAKHIRVLCFTPKGAEALCEIRQIVDDNAWFSIGFTAHGPLRWTALALNIFERTAGHGIPTTINGEPMAGASAPCTLAGAAAVGNAEILAGLVVNQILEPGRPCIYNLGLAHIFDMRAAIAVTGAPENHLLAAISAAMGVFYNLPSCSWVSTEAMRPDSQAALEKAIGFQTHMRNGVSLIWGVGQLESEMTVCPAQAVIDDDIVGYVKRYLRGVEVNDDALAVDVTRQVGIGGSFLSEEHTLKNFRKEFFEPSLLFRGTREAWKAAGSKPLHEAAEQKADQLIAADRVPLLNEEKKEALLRLEDDFLEKC